MQFCLTNQTKMPRFILNDESVRNSYGFKILTAGIYLERFNANPVMLDGHNSSNQSVIGRWNDIKVESGKLSADTEFDTEDENAKNISGKVDRGLIKGASMGVSFNKADLKMINGELTLEKCQLLEASIVAIPSNANALRLYVDGELMGDSDIKELCLNIAQNSPKNSHNFKTENNMLKLSQLAFLALGFSAMTQEAGVEEINSAVLALSKAKEDLEAKLQLSEEKVNAYVEAEKNVQLSATNKILDEAIVAGKFTADKRQTFADLAVQNFDLFKSTVEALPSKQTFSTGVTTPVGTSGISTMEDFQKLSINEQLAFKQNNPDAYKAIVASIRKP